MNKAQREAVQHRHDMRDLYRALDRSLGNRSDLSPAERNKLLHSMYAACKDVLNKREFRNASMPVDVEWERLRQEASQSPWHNNEASGKGRS